MQKFAFGLIGVGILLLIGWAARDFFFDDSYDLAVRLAVGAVGIGIFILIYLAVMDKIVGSGSSRGSRR